MAITLWALNKINFNGSLMRKRARVFYGISCVQWNHRIMDTLASVGSSFWRLFRVAKVLLDCPL